MKRIIIIYGCIGGGIIITSMMVTMPFVTNGTLDMGNSEWLGYITMTIALSMIFFGVKSYRDNQLNGAITFGEGFKVGILIALVASVIYVFWWEIYMHFFIPDFMEQYTSKTMEATKASGVTEEELAKKLKETTEMQEMYGKFYFRVLLTFSEIFPVGLLLSLVSAALLKRKDVLPA
jgi:uncharacterized membrane protein